MRRLKKLLVALLCCRMKNSTKLITLLFLIFVLGNIFFLRPYTWMEMKPTDRAITDKEIQDLQKAIRENIDKERNKINKEDENIRVRFSPRKTEPPVVETVHVDETKRIVIKDIKPATEAPVQKPTMAILVISCNRPEVKRCLDGLFKYKPTNIEMPIIVSQDCGHQATAEVIKSYGEKVIHIRQPELGDVRNVPSNMMRYMGYYKISRHYKWALTQVFLRPGIDSVVIVEDDLDIAPDFFEYFLATRPLLDEDPSLFCVSAWNDNGKSDLIDESAIDLLYRTDFFPGLGWLLTRKIWQEFADKWPLGFWDDWVRAPEQRKGRSCIRPEISRTRTFGRIGVSLGQFYDQYLQFIKLNEKPYPFLEYDLNHLLKQNYDRKFVDRVYSARESSDDAETMRVTYSDKYEFERIARDYGIMKDFKAGVPRTAYKGIVSIYKDRKRIYLAPKKDWQGYSEE